LKSRSSRKSANGRPETTSAIRAAVLMLDWQYCQRAPGSKAAGFRA
jgi:hypothetical protein